MKVKELIRELMNNVWVSINKSKRTSGSNGQSKSESTLVE